MFVWYSQQRGAHKLFGFWRWWHKERHPSQGSLCSVGISWGDGAFAWNASDAELHKEIGEGVGGCVLHPYSFWRCFANVLFPHIPSYPDWQQMKNNATSNFDQVGWSVVSELTWLWKPLFPRCKSIDPKPFYWIGLNFRLWNFCER